MDTQLWPAVESGIKEARLVTGAAAARTQWKRYAKSGWPVAKLKANGGWLTQAQGVRTCTTSNTLTIGAVKTWPRRSTRCVLTAGRPDVGFRWTNTFPRQA